MGNKLKFLFEYNNYINNIYGLNNEDDLKIFNNFNKHSVNNKIILLEGLITTHPIDKSIKIIKKRFNNLNIEKQEDGEIYIENINDEIINQLYISKICDPKDIGLKNQKSNLYLILKSDKSSALAYYNARTQKVENINKKSCYRITPRNSEQTFALHALLNDDVKLVSLQGKAAANANNVFPVPALP